MPVWKRVCALMLCVLMFVSVFAVAASAEDADTAPAAVVTDADGKKTCSCDYTPIVYVYGRQATYDDPKSPNRRELLSIKTSPEFDALIEGAVPYLVKALALGQWDPFCDYMAEGGAALFTSFAPDKDGNVTNGSDIDWSWSEEWLENNDFHSTSNFSVYGYVYDARLDPFEIAKDLNDYIEAVKRTTGHDKIALISRCQGSIFTFAYLAEYGWDSLETFLQYCTAVNGTTLFSEMMAGKIKFNADAYQRYTEQASFFQNDEVNYLVRSLIHYLNRYQTYDNIMAIVSKLYDKIYEKILPRIFRSSYATAPGYWGMVASKDYEDAKKLCFGGMEDEYSTLIAKLDHYDKRVRTQTYNILQAMHKDGVKLGNVVKSGMQMVPFCESYDMNSDDKITIEAQGFGTNSAKMGSEFDTKYLRNAIRNGTSKYISPDNTIDASTSLFPDTTWFIDGLSHYTFTGCEDDLLNAICKSKDEMTVWDNANFPQYMVVDWSINHTAPMVDEEQPEPTFQEKLHEWWRWTLIPTLIRMIQHLKIYLENKKAQEQT